MSRLSDYTRTGRVQLGPGSDLVELQTADGTRHTAIVFHPEFRTHNAINAALGVVLGYLESPMVSGLTDLQAYDLAESTFVYRTGHTWSVAECIRTLSDMGEAGGVRAGVELLARAGQTLIEAAENGESAGVYSHGGLTPWRILLDVEGRVQIIGHALPQVEILTFHAHPDRIPREDAFRYCPPERMEAKGENFSSDLFGLALVAFEMMLGKPVYDGLVNDIRAKAARGETSRRLHQFREFLPESVRDLLTTALRPDFRDRFGSGQAFLDAVEQALRDPSVQGASLRDVMRRVSQHQPRARQELDPAKTSMLSKDALRAMLDEVAEPEAPRRTRVEVPSAAPPSAPRAAPPPVREAPAPAPREDLSAPTAAAPESPVAAALRSGARPNPRAMARGEGAAAEPATPAAAPPPAAEPAVASPAPPSGPPAIGVARLPPRRAAEAGASPAIPPSPAAASPHTSGERRLRASGDTPETAAETLDRILRSSGSRARVPPLAESAQAVPPTGTEAAPASLSAPVAPPPAPQAAAPPPVLAPPPAPAAVEAAPVSVAPPLPAVPPPLPAPVEAAPPPAPALLAAAAPPLPSPSVTPPPAPPSPPAASRAPLQFTSLPDDDEDDEDDDGGHTMAFPRKVPPPAAPVAAAVPPPVAASVSAPAGPAAPTTAPASAPPTPVAPAPASAAVPPAGPLLSTPAATHPSGSLPSRGLRRAPETIRPPPRGAPLTYRLVRPGHPTQKRQGPGDATLAEIVGRLVGQAFPARTGLDGRVLGWWRLGSASAPLAADARLDSLGAEPELHLHFVEARTVHLRVEAPGVALLLPVSTALPAASLVDALVTTLGLDAGDWSLTLDGALLDAFHILDDRPFGPDARLALRRAG